MLLELVEERPRWSDALATALTRPRGMPERRHDEDPWTPSTDRPRRISDDLIWLRNAMDEPEEYGLRVVRDAAAQGAWEVTDDQRVGGHLERLDERGILEAAGFLFHRDSD